MRTDKGFTLLIAIVITATLLLVSTGIVSVAVKEAFISSSARESQHAFYAADTGIECAIYWDVRNESGISAFATSTQSQINCNNDNEGPFTVGGPTGVSTFEFDFDSTGNPYCAVVTVTKSGNLTLIESRGYNTCDPLNRRRVERAVRVGY